MDWFLYDRDLHHDRVKSKARLICDESSRGVFINMSKRERERERERESFVKIANGCISDGAFCENR